MKPDSKVPARPGYVTIAPAPPRQAVSAKPPVIAPPKTATITLTSEDINTGRLKITPGLREMIHYYHWRQEVQFTTYGNYPLWTHINESRGIMRSDDLRDWYHENGLRPDDQIHIEAPLSPKGHPRIYTAYERLSAGSKQSTVSRPRLWLRHFTYLELRTAGRYLHPTVIVKSIPGNCEVEQIRRVLRDNDHLFTTLVPKSSLWGLVEWNELEVRPSVDPTSLLLAIGEDDIVYQILTTAAEPLSTQVINRRIADYFMIPVAEVEHLTAVDASDPRLLRLTDARWCFRKWVEEWRKEKAAISGDIEKRRLLEEKLGELRKQEQELDIAATPYHPRGILGWLSYARGMILAVLADWVATGIAALTRQEYVTRGARARARQQAQFETSQKIAALENQLALTDVAGLLAGYDELSSILGLVAVEEEARLE
ncbi:MAG: hypothetical protein KAW89_02185 [Armatimonadetes bacterium]|nr:hypothetical protein [Armatimonadota bacterium]